MCIYAPVIIRLFGLISNSQQQKDNFIALHNRLHNYNSKEYIRRLVYQRVGWNTLLRRFEPSELPVVTQVTNKPNILAFRLGNHRSLLVCQVSNNVHMINLQSNARLIAYIFYV